MKFSIAVFVTTVAGFTLITSEAQKAQEDRLNVLSFRFVGDGGHAAYLRERTNTPPSTPTGSRPPPIVPPLPATPQNANLGQRTRGGPPKGYFESPMSADRPAGITFGGLGLPFQFQPGAVVVSTNSKIGFTNKDATFGTKKIDTENYPSYPKNGQGKNFHSSAGSKNVLKYYANEKDDITDWAVSKQSKEASKWRQILDPNYDPNAAPVPPPPGIQQAKPSYMWVEEPEIYNTEHVFEAQTVTNFFKWLQNHSDPKKKKTAAWIETWFVTKKDVKWLIPGPGITQKDNNVATNMLFEIGNRLPSRQDRLTVLLAAPNGIKGKLFQGNLGVSVATFSEIKESDLQILKLKDMGMVFTYMDDPKVWKCFCATFEGIRKVLAKFDTWYDVERKKEIDAEAKTRKIKAVYEAKSTMAADWSVFMRHELDAVVAKALANIEKLTAARKGKFSKQDEEKWNDVLKKNKALIKLTRTSTNLAPPLPASISLPIRPPPGPGPSTP